jgi:hypothetical protein
MWRKKCIYKIFHRFLETSVKISCKFYLNFDRNYGLVGFSGNFVENSAEQLDFSFFLDAKMCVLCDYAWGEKSAIEWILFGDFMRARVIWFMVGVWF